MKLVKTLAAAAVLAMSSFTAQSATMTVGDVTWDTSYSSDFFSVSQLSQWWSTKTTLSTVPTVKNQVYASSYVSPDLKAPGAAGSELMGVGLIGFVNGDATYSVSGNSVLTYAFGGFKSYTTFTTPLGKAFIFDPLNAWWKIYLTPKSTLSSTFSHLDTTAAQASSTVFLEGKFDSFSLLGRIDNATSNGYLKITGGQAQNAFKAASVLNPLTGTHHDFQVTGSASFQGSNTKNITNSGSLNFVSKSNVSAPSSLAILGLGLVCFAGMTRRKQAN